jgi:HlyD family secretion protein
MRWIRDDSGAARPIRRRRKDGNRSLWPAILRLGGLGFGLLSFGVLSFGLGGCAGSSGSAIGPASERRSDVKQSGQKQGGQKQTGQKQGGQKQTGQKQTGGQKGGRGGRGQDRANAPPVVEVLQATSSRLDDSTTYIGTTEPQQQVALRAQLSAQLLSLTVEIGDSVTPGQALGQLDATLLQAAVQEAEAELAVRQAELAQAKTQLAEASATINQAKAQQQQSRVDASRLRSLSAQGAIPQQQAELAQTQLRVAEQRLRLTQEAFRSQEQAIAAAQQRVMAQQAVLTQAQKQRSFTTLTAPTAGVVLTRLAEPGDLVQSGQDVLTLGDLRKTRVVVEVTDQARGQLAIGQTVQVQLDAVPNRTFQGLISQISPVANATSRLIPVKIALASSAPLGSGLLARVNFSQTEAQSVVIPQSAIELEASELGTSKLGASELGSGGSKSGTSPGSDRKVATIFTISGEGEDDGASPAATDRLKAKPQTVTLGSVRNGQVEVISGLRPGDRYIVKSDRPLKAGQQVKRSLASEF